jgi:ankyrin repeat protein
MAAEKGHTDVVALLLDAGVDIEAKDMVGSTID